MTHGPRSTILRRLIDRCDNFRRKLFHATQPRCSQQIRGLHRGNRTAVAVTK